MTCAAGDFLGCKLFLVIMQHLPAEGLLKGRGYLPPRFDSGIREGWKLTGLRNTQIIPRTLNLRLNGWIFRDLSAFLAGAATINRPSEIPELRPHIPRMSHEHIL